MPDESDVPLGFVTNNNARLKINSKTIWPNFYEYTTRASTPEREFIYIHYVFCTVCLCESVCYVPTLYDICESFCWWDRHHLSEPSVTRRVYMSMFSLETIFLIGPCKQLSCVKIFRLKIQKCNRNNTVFLWCN